MIVLRPAKCRSGGDDRRVDSFVAVYVDGSAQVEAVSAAVATLAVPSGVSHVSVVRTDTFDCRIAVDLSGDFEAAQGQSIARSYAEALREALGVPVYCLADLLMRDYPAS
jgi:N-acetyl-gamma-glutamylphosphate reductase